MPVSHAGGTSQPVHVVMPRAVHKGSRFQWRAWWPAGLLLGACTLINDPDERDACERFGDSCDPIAACVSDGADFSCECPEGYRDVHGNGTECEDIDECEEGSDRCHALAECANTEGDHICACPDGYLELRDGAECEEINECRTGQHDCDAASQDCRNLEGPGFECVCKPGFEPGEDDARCVDVDECVAGHDCVAPAACENRLGGYMCRCPPGIAQEDLSSCMEVDPCSPEESDCGDGTRCVVDGLSYRCDCLEGYDRVDGSRCGDVDECLDDPCQDLATCDNHPGGFTCQCPGYYSVADDGVSCEDRRAGWSTAVGGWEHAQVLVDGDDNVYHLGSFVGGIRLCDASHAAAGTRDVFIVKYAPDRSCDWVATYGDSSVDQFIDAALDREGNLIFTFAYYGSMDVGGRALDSGGYRARAVAKLAPDGRARWVSSFFNVDPEDLGYSVELGGLAADSEGHVLWAGRKASAVALGTAEHVDLEVFEDDGLLVKLDADDGHVLWSQDFTGINRSVATSVAVDASDNVLVGGTFHRTVTVAGQQLLGPTRSEGLVAKFDPAGELQWIHRLKGDIRNAAGGVDLTTTIEVISVADGDLIVSGPFRGELDLLDPHESVDGAQDIFIARLDGSTGEPIRVSTFGGRGDDRPVALVPDGAGRFLVAGRFLEAIDFGDGLLLSAGTDLFAASFTIEGELRWSQRCGGVGRERFPSAAVAASGDVYISGAFVPPMSINGEELPDPGGDHGLFLLHLRP